MLMKKLFSKLSFIIFWPLKLFKSISCISILNQFLYFLIAIVIIGSIGIWLPQLFYYVKSKEIDIPHLYQNLTTYYSAILAVGLTDILIHLVRNKDVTHKTTRVLLLVLFGLLAFTYFGYICYSVWIEKKNLFLVSLIGLFMSYVIWWISMSNAELFKTASVDAALGGDAS